MKKILTIIALAVAALGAQAQDASSTSNSGSNSGAASNANAIGNVNASRSDSASQSGAQSGSISGAAGNVIVFNPGTAGATAQGAGGIPTTRVINQQDGATRAEQILSGGTTNTTTESVNYHGTYTIKSAPAIAMSGPASGPCTGSSGGLGLSGPGWGFGANGSSVMADCRLRENTRVIGMAMQSLDGAANPQEKGEITVMFMDAVRGLAAYNNQIIAEEVKQPKAK
jgi:hypothetical protein